jgi:hypothetical protein
MMWIVLLFGVPMMLAAVMISPSGLHNLVHSLPVCLILGLILPVVGWQTFLRAFVFPPSGDGRVAAVLKLWLGGTVLACAVINLVVAALGYSPAQPGPDPVAGFLLAAFVLSMFVSCGFWGAFAPILSPEFARRGALATSILLFVAVVALGYVVAG